MSIFLIIILLYHDIEHVFYPLYIQTFQDFNMLWQQYPQIRRSKEGRDFQEIFYHFKMIKVNLCQHSLPNCWGSRDYQKSRLVSYYLLEILVWIRDGGTGEWFVYVRGYERDLSLWGKHVKTGLYVRQEVSTKKSLHFSLFFGKRCFSSSNCHFCSDYDSVFTGVSTVLS